MQKVKIQVVEQVGSKLKSEWESLWQGTRDAHFYNSPYWFEVTKDIDGGRHLIFTARRGDKLIAVLPLVRSRKFLINVFAGPGKQHLDKSTLLVKEEGLLLKFLIDNITDFGNLYLAFVDEDIVNKSGKLTEDTEKYFACYNPYIPVEDDPLRFLSKKQRSKIRNRIKRYKNNLDYESYSGNNIRAFEEVLAIEEKSHKKDKGIDTFSNPYSLSLFKKIMDKYPTHVSIDILYFDKTPICYQIGFSYKSKFIGVLTAYDDDFSHVIPGKILLWHLLKRLRKEDYEIFDFSKGDSILKKEFTKFKNKQYDLFHSSSWIVRFWWRFCLSITRGLKEIRIGYILICKFRKTLRHFNSFFPVAYEK